MADDASQLPQEKDPDLVRWARELGVTYAELVSTLNYAGPTFKDGVVELIPPGTPVSPRDTAPPCLLDAGNTPDALSPGIAAARHLPR